jgi:PAS domain S-box-containing protein
VSLEDDETERMRSVAVQNAREVVAERKRVEQALLQAQEDLREQARVLELLNKTGAMLASNLKQDAIIQTVTDAVTEMTGAQFGAFFYNTIGEEGEAFLLYTLAGAPREAFSKFPLPRATPLFGPTFRGEKIIRADDILESPLYGHWGPHFGMPAGHLPVRSYLAVPVVSRSGEVHGGLFLGHGEPAMFTASHEAIVAGIAPQAAIAIDNSRLFETAERSRQELEQLTQTLEQRVEERTTALQRSERQFQQLVAGITDCAIYMIDRNGFVASWNLGAERIKGYDAEEIIGQHFGIFYNEEDRAAGLPAEVLRAAATQGKYEAENWRVRKDGTRFWASVLIDPIRDSAGEIVGFAKITRDMTERRAMQEQLHQSQKMEAIGQLTGGVAHDFNNLLTVILGNLESLARYIPEAPRARRALDQATRGAQRAATLTSQLLAFSRRQPLNPKPTDANQLVSGMSDLIRRSLGESIAIETVLAAGVWRIEVDSNQLENALLNLAVNARDAMPKGGKLTLETTNAHIDEQYAGQYAEISPGQYVLISVSDTGAGMTREVLARAFDPFFTTKPLGEGTGLGLSQVFGFVKQSGGHIKLYSEIGQGTTVKIYLPRSTSAAVPDEAESPLSESRGDSSEAILVVEDDDGVRLYSTESLRDLGFTVHEANDASSALRILEHHPEIMLLFTDVGLPGINGRELVERARRIRPGLRVLFTTGYARNAIVHQGRLDPGVELLPKPFTRAQLGERVRAVLDAPGVPTGDRVALIVEDEPLVRLLLADTLQELGFEVVQAASARDGMAAAERLVALQVAFVDVGLPDRSGMELARELRTRWPALRVAIASGYGGQAIGSFANDPLATALAKPFDSAAVAAALDRLGISTVPPAAFGISA